MGSYEGKSEAASACMSHELCGKKLASVTSRVGPSKLTELPNSPLSVGVKTGE